MTTAEQKNIDGDGLKEMADVWEAEGSWSLSARINDKWTPQLGPKYMLMACSGEFPVKNLRITSKIFTKPECINYEDRECKTIQAKLDKALEALKKARSILHQITSECIGAVDLTDKMYDVLEPAIKELETVEE